MLVACICYDVLSDLRLYDSGGKDSCSLIGLLLLISSRIGVSFVYIWRLHFMTVFGFGSHRCLAVMVVLAILVCCDEVCFHGRLADVSTEDRT